MPRAFLEKRSFGIDCKHVAGSADFVHAVKICRKLANRKWSKGCCIRLIDVSLSRPPMHVEKSRVRRWYIREDEGIRSAVEGKFGQEKRRYGLGRVMA